MFYTGELQQPVTKSELKLDTSEKVEGLTSNKSLEAECIKSIHEYLGSSGNQVFLTINAHPWSLFRGANTHSRSLSSEFALRSSDKSVVNQYRTLYQKFLSHLNTAAFGKQRASLGEHIRYFCVLENQGKKYYKDARALHAHLLLALPEELSFEEFERKTRSYWHKYVDPHSARIKFRSEIKPYDFEDLKKQSLEVDGRRTEKGMVLCFISLQELEHRLVQYLLKQVQKGGTFNERTFSSIDTTARRFAA